MFQIVKKLPAMQESGVRSLGQEDPLETGMATHSSILAWEIPWTEDPGRLQSMGSQRDGLNLVTKHQQWSGVEKCNLDRRPRFHPFCFSPELNISASQWARQVTAVRSRNPSPSWIERTASLLTQSPRLCGRVAMTGKLIAGSPGLLRKKSYSYLMCHEG